MAETITIFGKKVPKTAMYIAGAGAAGIIGYAWWTKGTSGEVAPVPEIPEPVDVPTDDPGFTATSGSAPPDTNADWGELAVQRLISIGLDGPAVSSAIGKFLQRKNLNAVEVDLVQQAIRAAGYPPRDGPWTVKTEPALPPAVVNQDEPGAVRNLRARAYPNFMVAYWDAPASSPGSPSIQSYHVEFYAGTAGGGTSIISSFDVSRGEGRSPKTLQKGHRYGVRVQAVGTNGKRGPFAKTTAFITGK